MKRFNTIGPSIDPWDTPLVTSLQLDLVPLITTVYAWQFPIFPIYLAVSIFHQLVYEDVTGDSVESLTKMDFIFVIRMAGFRYLQHILVPWEDSETEIYVHKNIF